MLRAFIKRRKMAFLLIEAINKKAKMERGMVDVFVREHVAARGSENMETLRLYMEDTHGCRL